MMIIFGMVIHPINADRTSVRIIKPTILFLPYFLQIYYFNI